MYMNVCMRVCIHECMCVCRNVCVCVVFTFATYQDNNTVTVHMRTLHHQKSCLNCIIHTILIKSTSVACKSHTECVLTYIG